MAIGCGQSTFWGCRDGKKQLLRGRPRSFKQSRKLYRDSCRMLDIICRSSQSSPYVTYSQNSCASPSPSRYSDFEAAFPAFEAVTKFYRRNFAKFSELIKHVKRGIHETHSSDELDFFKGQCHIVRNHLKIENETFLEFKTFK